MKLITRQFLASDAANRFAAQYAHDRTRDVIVSQLRALPAPVDPDAVDDIIGNKSWTVVPRCHECGHDDLSVVVQVGEEPDCESHDANLCIECARKAMTLLEAQP